MTIPTLSQVTVTLTDHVATIEFSCDTFNYLSVDLMQELVRAWEWADAEIQCRAIVLCSAGRVFCAGVDFRSMAGADGDSSPRPLYQLALRLLAGRKPCIVAVQGAAVGAGLGLAMLADQRVAGPKTQFNASFVQLGFHAGFGLTAIFQAFLPSMRKRGCGKLIAMSSLVGQVPFPFESIYSASKFAIEGMVMSLRYEVAPFGIHVALIEPAQVSTSFASKIHQLPPDGSPYRERARRFIARDDELIKTAPTPQQAGRRIAEVVRQAKPPFHNQIDFMSTVFLFLNRFLPRWMRDAILLNHMDIK